jgi:hypothetical protein
MEKGKNNFMNFIIGIVNFICILIFGFYFSGLIILPDWIVFPMFIAIWFMSVYIFYMCGFIKGLEFAEK